MTPLNTIIEEEIEFLFSGENEVGKFKHQGIGNCTKENITTAMQRAYEAGQAERDTYWKERVGEIRLLIAKYAKAEDMDVAGLVNEINTLCK